MLRKTLEKHIHISWGFNNKTLVLCREISSHLKQET